MARRPKWKPGAKLTFDVFPLERIQSPGRVDESNGHFAWHALTIAQRRLESPLFCSLDGHRGEASGEVPQDAHVARRAIGLDAGLDDNGAVGNRAGRIAGVGGVQNGWSD